MNLLAFITWTVNPVAFSIGSMEIRWYGILLALGFVLAYMTLQQIFKKEEVPQKTLDKFSIWTIVWCIVGLRLGHFLFYEPEFLVAHPLQVLLPIDEEGHFIGYQGLASHGGAIAMLTTMRSTLAPNNLYLSKSLHDHLYDKDDHQPLRFGDIYREAKADPKFYTLRISHKHCQELA